MKRSNLVTAIAAFLGEISDFTYDKRKVEADILLKTLEDLGMKPPMLKEKSFQILDNGEMTYEVNEWEPE